MIWLKSDLFEEYKSDYKVYGTHTETDKYNNVRTVRDTEEKAVIHTMWHPLRDEADIAEYGENINKMYYCILFDIVGIKHGDVIEIDGEEYEVTSVKKYNTHTRLDVTKKKVD